MFGASRHLGPLQLSASPHHLTSVPNRVISRAVAPSLLSAYCLCEPGAPLVKGVSTNFRRPPHSVESELRALLAASRAISRGVSFAVTRVPQAIVEEVMASAVEQKVEQIIVEQLGVDESQVDNKASFVDDLGADSLDIVELVMAFEEAFELEIPDEDAEKIATVGDAVTYIEGKKKD